MVSPVPPELSRAFFPHHLRLLLIDAKTVPLTQGTCSHSGYSRSQEHTGTLEVAEVGVQEMRIYRLPNPTNYSDTQPLPHTPGPCPYLSASWRITGEWN